MLLLSFTLVGCADRAAPAQPDPPSVAYRQVDDLCAKLDHGWLTERVGQPVRIRYFPEYQRNGTNRKCVVAAGVPDNIRLYSVDVHTSVDRPTDQPSEPAPTGSAARRWRDVPELGEGASILLGSPFRRDGAPDEGLPAESRLDTLTVDRGTATVGLMLKSFDESVPDDEAVRSVLVAYATEVLQLMQG
ncbi:hypothetical protein D7223_23475 [Micromonospora endolithica]|uniref:DUF3558 domain-containing protein n=1 Tax=Micromonospora endolithica TaxID=230091 RepID=A0A3A9Z149_9ACTN|nr:hypothetical protein D7223_23475 [Micromonospora endolithica]TWJ19925.1 hypothetical protein JD76_00011 [Micromonospora endolithica]